MTLVEVLVASVILGVGVAGLLSAAGMSLRNQRRGELRAQALCLAQAKLGEVDLIGPHVWMLARPASGEERLGDVTFAWRLDIQQKQAGELFDVRVQVDWSGAGSGGVELGTWLNDYPARAAASAAGMSPGGAAPPQAGGR